MSLSLAIWISVALAKAVALVAAWRPGLDRGYRCLRWYFILAIAVDLGEFVTLQRFGYRSLQYKYVYYLGDLAIVVCGYFVLTRLVELAFARTALRLPRLRSGAILLFSGLAALSAAMVYFTRGQLTTTTYAYELEQNLSFLGMVLAVVLFAGLNILQVRGVRIRRVVLAFSLLYSSGALVYALTAILPALASAAFYLVPLTALLGMGLIAFSLVSPEPLPVPPSAALGLRRASQSA